MDQQMIDFLSRHPECEAPSEDELVEVTEILTKNGKSMQRFFEQYMSTITDDEFESEFEGCY